MLAVLQAILQTAACTQVDTDINVNHVDSDGRDISLDPDALKEWLLKPNVLNLVDASTVQMISVLMVVLFAGAVYGMTQARSKLPLFATAVLVVASIPYLLQAPPQPGRTSPGRFPSGLGRTPSGPVIPLPSEYPTRALAGDERQADLVRSIVMKYKHHKLDEFMACQTCMDAVQVAELVGAITKRTAAARMVLGNQLQLPENRNLKQALEDAERAADEHRNGQLSHVKIAAQVSGQLVQDWQRQVKMMEKKSREVTGKLWNAFGFSASVEDAGGTKWVKMAESELDDIEESGKVLSMKKISDMYYQTVQNFRESLIELPQTYPDESRQLHDAEDEVHKIAAAVAQLDGKLIEAKRDLALAEANRRVYRDLNASQVDMDSQLVDQIHQKQQKLEAAEKRVRDYTWRMWGIWTSMWENDVKQARLDVDTADTELKLLVVRLDQHKANMLKAKEKGGLEATMDAEYEEANLTVVHWQEEKDSKLLELNKAQQQLTHLTGTLEQKLSKANVTSLRELQQMKHIHKTIMGDALNARAAAQMDAEPFEHLKKVLRRVVAHMRSEEMLLPQADHLRSFLTLTNEAEFAKLHLNKSDWQSLLEVYTSINKKNFALLLDGDDAALSDS